MKKQNATALVLQGNVNYLLNEEEFRFLIEIFVESKINGLERWISG